MISEKERKEMVLSARRRGLQESCRKIVCQAFSQEKPGARLSADAKTAQLLSTALMIAGNLSAGIFFLLDPGRKGRHHG